jgi:hypothetical protein
MSLGPRTWSEPSPALVPHEAHELWADVDWFRAEKLCVMAESMGKVHATLS